MEIPEFSVHSLFCEDIRQEIGGSQTFVGVMRSPAGVPSFPGSLSKLYIALDMWADANSPWVPVEVTILKRAEGKPDEILATTTVDFDEAVVPKANPGDSIVMVSAAFAFQPLVLAEPSTISIKVMRNGKEYRPPALRFVQAEPPPHVRQFLASQVSPTAEV